MLAARKKSELLEKVHECPCQPQPVGFGDNKEIYIGLFLGIASLLIANLIFNYF